MPKMGKTEEKRRFIIKSGGLEKKTSKSGNFQSRQPPKKRRGLRKGFFHTKRESFVGEAVRSVKLGSSSGSFFVSARSIILKFLVRPTPVFDLFLT